MRRLVSFLAVFAVASLAAAPVSAAAPIENGWNTFTGSVFNSCTGEVIDDHGSVDTVLLRLSHTNVHWVGIGVERRGLRVRHHDQHAGSPQPTRHIHRGTSSQP